MMMVVMVVAARDHVAPVAGHVMPARRVVAMGRRMVTVMVGPGRGHARGHGQGQARGERKGHELQGSTPVFPCPRIAFGHSPFWASRDLPPGCGAQMSMATPAGNLDLTMRV
jgi:hypothetical protein